MPSRGGVTQALRRFGHLLGMGRAGGQQNQEARYPAHQGVSTRCCRSVRLATLGWPALADIGRNAHAARAAAAGRVRACAAAAPQRSDRPPLLATRRAWRPPTRPARAGRD
ncbi:hypothetical protein BGP34_31730, partial [Bacillus mycoides]